MAVSNDQIAKFMRSAESRAVLDEMRDRAVDALESVNMGTDDDNAYALELVRRLQAIAAMRRVAIDAENLEKRRDAAAERRERQGDN